MPKQHIEKRSQGYGRMSECGREVDDDNHSWDRDSCEACARVVRAREAREAAARVKK